MFEFTAQEMQVIRDALAYTGKLPYDPGGSFPTQEYLRVLAVVEEQIDAQEQDPRDNVGIDLTRRK